MRDCVVSSAIRSDVDELARSEEFRSGFYQQQQQQQCHLNIYHILKFPVQCSITYSVNVNKINTLLYQIILRNVRGLLTEVNKYSNFQ